MLLTKPFIQDKINLSFDLYANFFFGMFLNLELNTGGILTISPPYRKWESIRQSGANTSISRSFGILEVDPGILVTVNTNFITLEAEASYVLPICNDPDFPGRKVSFS